MFRISKFSIPALQGIRKHLALRSAPLSLATIHPRAGGAEAADFLMTGLCATPRNQFSTLQMREKDRTRALLGIINDEENGQNIRKMADKLVAAKTTTSELSQLLMHFHHSEQYDRSVKLYECSNVMSDITQRSGGSAASGAFSDEILLCILRSYSYLQKTAQARQMMPLFSDNIDVKRRAISLLLQAYCESDRFHTAEQILSHWLEAWLSASSSSGNGNGNGKGEGEERKGKAKANLGVVGGSADLNSMLQGTLKTDADSSSLPFSDRLTHGRDSALLDISSIRGLLALLQERSKAATRGTPGSAASAAASASNANTQPLPDSSSEQRINTLFDSSVAQSMCASSFPSLETWKSVARMYSVRGAHKESMLVLDICNLGLSHRYPSPQISHVMQSVYYSTVKALCKKMHFQQAAVLMQQMRESGLLPSARQQSKLLLYLKSLEVVDVQVLELLTQGTRTILDQYSLPTTTAATTDSAAAVTAAAQSAPRPALHALTASLITVLCHHNQVQMAVTFVENTSSASENVFSPFSLVDIVLALLQQGEARHLDAAMRVFQFMIDVKSPKYSTINRSRKPGIGAAVDEAYHHLCRAMRGDPARLAYFLVAYKHSFLPSRSQSQSHSEAEVEEEAEAEAQSRRV